MIINKYSMSEGVIEHYKEVEKHYIEKMYPGVNIDDKYVLFLKAELWFPFDYEEIDASVIFNYKNEHKTYPYKIRTPYPNKNIKQASMVNGRKVCDCGIPVLFDTYEELCELTSVDITWRISAFDSDDDLNVIYVRVHYDLEFTYEEGKRIYGLYSKDNTLDSFSVMEGKDYYEKSVSNYLNEFDVILFINGTGNGISCNCVNGTIDDDEIIIEEAISTIGLGDMLSTIKDTELLDNQDKNTIDYLSAYIYKAKVNLLPDIIAVNLMH